MEATNLHLLLNIGYVSFLFNGIEYLFSGFFNGSYPKYQLGYLCRLYHTLG